METNQLCMQLNNIKIDENIPIETVEYENSNQDFDDIMVEFTEQPEETSLNNNTSIHNAPITGLVYDEKMGDYSCAESTHVERPERIFSIYKKLEEEGLVKRCKLLKSRYATEEEILLKHNKEHFDFIKTLESKSSEELECLSDDFESIYFHQAVSECSLLAAGCTLEVVEAVLKGTIKNGVAVVRPPGHHALEHCSMGFCHFNNVALAAMLAISKYNLKRILILDWDVHYGNGIHKMFESDPKVLYFSLHRYDNRRFWPNLEEGNYDSIGKDAGLGYNIHVAWNQGKMGDSEYLCAMDHLLLPIMKEYQPELILVSAGFDSGLNDPLGRCCITPQGYAHMTKTLMSYANGNVVLVLEGGYNLKTISNSMAACVSTLLGDPVSNLDLHSPHPSAVLSISNTLHALQKHWKWLSLFDEMFVQRKEKVEHNYKQIEVIDISSSSSDEGDDSAGV